MELTIIRQKVKDCDICKEHYAIINFGTKKICDECLKKIDQENNGKNTKS